MLTKGRQMNNVDEVVGRLKRLSKGECVEMYESTLNLEADLQTLLESHEERRSIIADLLEMHDMTVKGMSHGVVWQMGVLWKARNAIDQARENTDK